MKYKESSSQSSEYLRLTIPLMSKQAAALTPMSFAVWYEYVSNTNPRLNQDIDALLQKGQTLTNEITESLYLKYISECDEEMMKRVHADVRRILVNLSNSAAKTKDEAFQFDHSLEQYGSQLEGLSDGKSVQRIVDQLLVDTRAMRVSVSALQDELAETRLEVDDLRTELKKVKEEAITDSLTGLLNRNGFSKVMEQLLPNPDRSKEHPSLLLLDIDRFKHVNDTYGHLLGDKVIKYVANTLRKRIKGKDTAARYGGDEFAILLVETTLAGACAVAEDIRKTIEKGYVRRTDNDQSIDNITVSIGVARYCGDESSIELIERADQALYTSKTEGRNKITVNERQ